MPDDFQPPSDPPVRSTECSAAIRDTLFKLWWRGDGWTTDQTKVAVMTRDDAERLKRKSWSHDPHVQVTSPPNDQAH